MDIILAFLVGVIIGWFIDWYFWRRQSGPSEAENMRIRELKNAEAKNRELNALLEKALIRKPEVVIKEVKVTTGRDRLQEVKGIGDVFAGRLNEAGIYTFSELATTSPERIEAIIKPQKWQKFNYREWANAAHELASQQPLVTGLSTAN